jgi:prepilin peptidase CpaA
LFPLRLGSVLLPNRMTFRAKNSWEGSKMLDQASLSTAFAAGWPVKLVCFVLVVAAVIDGWKLKVPNWITFPLVLSGWAYGVALGGWDGLVFSLVGTAVGLALLLPAYAVGGMGAGDVKLLAGVGAWTGASVTFFAFCASAVVGAVIALGMVLYKRSFRKHYDNFRMILGEFLVIRNPNELAELAAARKPSMLLLPYGIPLAIGSIGYFLWAGML